MKLIFFVLLNIVSVMLLPLLILIMPLLAALGWLKSKLEKTDER